MDIFEAIAKRHSYRGTFGDQNVPRVDLKGIVQAGLQAPSGKNEQTTTFVIVDDPDLVRQIGAMPSANKAIQQAQAFVACILDLRPEAVYEGHDFQIEDCAAAVENMLLAITALGYATVWLDGALRVDDIAARVGRILGVPGNRSVRILLPLGAALQPGSQKEKLPFDQRAWFNQYGG